MLLTPGNNDNSTNIFYSTLSSSMKTRSHSQNFEWIGEIFTFSSQLAGVTSRYKGRQCLSITGAQFGLDTDAHCIPVEIRGKFCDLTGCPYMCVQTGVWTGKRSNAVNSALTQ